MQTDICSKNINKFDEIFYEIRSSGFPILGLFYIANPEYGSFDITLSYFSECAHIDEDVGEISHRFG